jgi:hypothetical protein
MKLSLHSLLEKSIINLMFEEDNVQIGLSDAQANGLATVLTNLGIDPEAVIGEVGDGVIPEATKPMKTLETAQSVQPKVKKPKWYMKVSRKAIAAAKKYFEVGSCSNLTDAQARRLGIRARGSDGNYLVHTLNNTVLATPRALIAFLENNYNEDGSVSIPKALQPYMGGKTRV